MHQPGGGNPWKWNRGNLKMAEFGEKYGTFVPLTAAEYRLGFRVNTRTLTFSRPFYTALHCATQKKDYLSSYVWGGLVLYPLFMFGLWCHDP